jgi:hypothetical protein
MAARLFGLASRPNEQSLAVLSKLVPATIRLKQPARRRPSRISRDGGVVRNTLHRTWDICGSQLVACYSLVVSVIHCSEPLLFVNFSYMAMQLGTFDDHATVLTSNAVRPALICHVRRSFCPPAALIISPLLGMKKPSLRLDCKASLATSGRPQLSLKKLLTCPFQFANIS